MSYLKTFLPVLQSCKNGLSRCLDLIQIEKHIHTNYTSPGLYTAIEKWLVNRHGGWGVDSSNYMGARESSLWRMAWFKYLQKFCQLIKRYFTNQHEKQSEQMLEK